MGRYKQVVRPQGSVYSVVVRMNHPTDQLISNPVKGNERTSSSESTQ